jgi:hypothetical protein
MTNKATRWSTTEVDTLVSMLRSSPENLKKTFEEFSKQSGRPAKAVHVKYYTDIKKNHPMFQLGNQKHNLSNTKNVPRPKGDKEISVELKQEYTSMIKSLFKKFTEEEKVQIIKSLI